MLIGLWTRPALLALGGVLVLVTFGHLVKEALFSFTGHVIPRTALLLFVLMPPRGADWFSLDGWLARRKGRSGP